MGGRYAGDNQHYVPKDELEAWEARDPIDRYVRRLLESGWAAPDELEAIDAKVGLEIDDALAVCENEPLPDPSTALSGVLADPASAPIEWYRLLP
ncbi:MAG: thiamine pyrophosphate-dependent enzyme [Gemmatimonadales bacterium]